MANAAIALVALLLAFVLALGICSLLDLFALPWAAKLTVVANVGLCIASSKMFAFYPAQIDLGALAVITCRQGARGSLRREADGVAPGTRALSRDQAGISRHAERGRRNRCGRRCAGGRRGATVDDRSVPVLEVNLAFAAVPVPQGRHRVGLGVEPATRRMDRVVSMLALLGWAAFSASRWLR